ncbi:hypothetical protein MCEGEM3_01989 [Oxalobacteraceae bacterium]
MVRDGVVASISTAVAADQCDCFTVGDVFIAEGTRRSDIHHIAHHQSGASRCAAIHRRASGTVINFVGDGDARDAQGLRGDVGRAASLIRDGIVGDIGTGVAAAECDDFASADIFIRKHTGRRYIHQVAGQQTTEHDIAVGDGCTGGTVIDAAIRDQTADGQCFGRDGGRRAGLIGNAVVGKISTAVATA